MHLGHLHLFILNWEGSSALVNAFELLIKDLHVYVFSQVFLNI
jgi:hypothetical protein